MANEFKHDSVGSQLSQTEYEAVGGHVLDSQAAGDIIYASSTSQLSSLGIGTAGKVLMTNSGTSAPEWSAAITGVTSILATDIKIGEDDQTKIDFETADEIHFYAANVEQVYLGDNIFGPQTDSDVDLGSTGVRWKDAFVDSITVTGEVDGASLDISGNADIDGTTNLDAVDIDGAVQIDATVTIGADDQGYDIIFYGDTASANLTWDTSVDDLILNGAARIVIPDSQLVLGSTAVTTTGSEINLIDGGTARGTTSVASGDGILINDAGTMRMTNVDTVSTYFASHSVGGTNIVTVGTIGTGTWQGTAIASAYIAADAITGAKIADDALDSEHYTDGSIDTAHLAADAITGAKIADDAINSEHYTDGSIDTAHIADNQVTVGKLADLSRGSVIYGNASAATAELTKGSANTVLTSDGTDIAWAATQAPSGAQTGITTIYNSSLILGYGASHANIDFTTDNSIIFDIDGTSQIQLDDGILKPTTDVDVDLGTSTLRYKSIYAQKFAMDISADGIAEHDYSGITALVRVGDGADIGAFDLVHISDVTNEVQISDASAIATSRVIGINPSNSAISDNSEGIILLHGVVRDDSWNWTTGATLYLSETAGDITATAPSTTDACVVPIGIALEPDMIYFNPTQTIIEHA